MQTLMMMKRNDCSCALPVGGGRYLNVEILAGTDLIHYCDIKFLIRQAHG